WHNASIKSGLVAFIKLARQHDWDERRPYYYSGRLQPADRLGPAVLRPACIFVDQLHVSTYVRLEYCSNVPVCETQRLVGCPGHNIPTRLQVCSSLSPRNDFNGLALGNVYCLEFLCFLSGVGMGEMAGRLQGNRHGDVGCGIAQRQEAT